MGLTKDEIKSFLLTLPKAERSQLLGELQDLAEQSGSTRTKLSRREILDNK